MTRFLPALAAIALLSACDQQACTKESLDQMTTDLMVRVQAFGAENPDRMGEIGPKLAGVLLQAQSASGDLQPACEAVAALMKDVGG